MRIWKKTFRCPAIACALLALPLTAHAYTVSGHVQCQANDFPLYGGEVRAYEVDPVPGGSFTISLLFSAPVNTSGDFSSTVSWPAGGGGFEAGDPDLVFEVVQNVSGTVQPIYQELSSSARWNIADGSHFILKSESPLAVCPDPSVSPSSVPADSLFLFTRVGSAPTAEIDCKGSAAKATGYWRPRKAPFSFTGTDTDQPFGRTLDLFGWFGKKAKVDYFKLRFSSDGGASWSDVDTSLPNYWYDTSDPNPLQWHWVSQSMGPFTVGSINNLYQIPFFVRPNTPWSWLDRVGRLDTTKAPDGINRLRIVAYKWSGGSLVKATSSDLTIDPNYGEIVLQVDNTPPTVQILNVKRNGVSQPACGILNLGAADKLGVDFRVYDVRGHLRDYTLDAKYGHDCTVTPRPAAPSPAYDNYNNNASASPSWQGNLSYSTEYLGSVYLPGPTVDCSVSPAPANRMPSCAYQLRLWVSKRTTNGYGLIYHYVEDTWHVTIQR